MLFQKFTRYSFLTILALLLFTGIRAQEQKIAYTDSWQKAATPYSMPTAPMFR